MRLSALFCLLVAGLLVMTAASAKTPDGKTPAVETVCDVFKGAKKGAFGLCNAYCEAMDCGDPNQHAANRACTRVNDNFEKKFGFRLPEGFNDVDDEGNWINNCLVDGGGDDG